MYGFHDAIPMLQQLEPQFFQDSPAELMSPKALALLLTDYFIRTNVPPGW
jgi:hypothetical protein